MFDGFSAIACTVVGWETKALLRYGRDARDNHERAVIRRTRSNREIVTNTKKDKDNE